MAAAAAAATATPLCGSLASPQEQGMSMRKKSALFSSFWHHPSSSSSSSSWISLRNSRAQNRKLSAVEELAAAAAPELVTKRRSLVVLSMAATKKGNKKKGGGESTASNKNRGAGGAGAKESAYANETRRIILSVQKLRKVTPTGKELLKNINIGMYLGAKIGVLGPNGAGKSTLLKILAGVDKNFDGNLHLDPGIRVGYLQQEPELDDEATVMENIEPAIAETRQLLADFEQVSVDMARPDADIDKLMSKMEHLQNALDACNGWELERQVERALNALRCPPSDSPVVNLSGGERRRVALCSLLLQTPDVLLLDEPTNHLDAEAVAWLERYLAEFKGTVVAITHDRYFLDNVSYLNLKDR
jgi:sulfate-transporting ATPase